MDRFSDNSNRVARHFHSLKLRLQKADGSVRDKRDFAVASVQALLSAHANGPTILDAGTRGNPALVSIDVILRGRAGETRCEAVHEANEPKPVGAINRFKVSKTGAVLTVAGAESLFESAQYFREYVQQVANLLGNLGPERMDGGVQRRSTRLPCSMPSSGVEQHRPHCKPLLEHLEMLGKEVAGTNSRSARLAWAWLTRSCGGEARRPFILLHLPTEQESPWLMNPDGEQGIIHRVIGSGAPSIVWHYATRKGWDLPTDRKIAWERWVDSKANPHLLYIPIGPRLAGQMCFGSGCDPREILDEATELQALASSAVNLAFEESIYYHLLQLSVRKPGINWRNTASSGAASREMHALLTSLLDIYPVHGISLDNEDTCLAFASSNLQDKASLQLVGSANRAIQQARDTIAALAETNSWIDYGKTMIGIQHTLRRPIKYMMDYVETVAPIVAGDETLRVLTEDTRVLLRKMDIFGALDAAHLSILNEFRDNRPECHVTTCPGAILAHLVAKRYLPEAAARVRDSSAGRLQVPEGVHEQIVAWAWSRAASYPIPTEAAAMLIAELVENAAEYARKHLRDSSAYKRRPPFIEVIFNSTSIIVASELKPHQRTWAIDRINQSKPEGSVQKVRNNAHFFGFELLVDSSDPNRVSLILRNNE